MRAVAMMAGLVVPGAAQWLTGERAKAGVYAGMVVTLVAAGAWLGGSTALPTQAELAGLDGTAWLMFRGGAAVKALAGLPYYALAAAVDPPTFLAGIAHEYGTKLLTMAGLVNLLAVADVYGKEGK